MIHIVSFSGGKDSTAMLLKMIEKDIQIDEIIMSDTGLEFADLYEHIEKVETLIGRSITILKPAKSFEYYMFDHIKVKGKTKGSKGYSWPYYHNRWCTSALKRNVINKYLKKYSDEILQYHGIAADEQERVGRNKEVRVRYPLVEWGMSESDCLEYCYDKGLNWNGLYEKFDRLGCWCCPLQGHKDLRVLYHEYPEYWEKLKEYERRTYRRFKEDYSVFDLERKFEIEDKKNGGPK